MILKEYKNGAWTTFERLTPSGFYLVRLFDPAGNLQDKVRADTYRGAREYLRAFNKLARAYK
jgi:hypothetical protein